MIKILKKQLSSTHFLFFVFSFLLLAGVFGVTLRTHPSFYLLVGAAHLFIVVYLFVLRNHFIQTQAECELQKQDYLEKINLLQAEIADQRLTSEAIQKKSVSYSHLKELTEKLSLCLSLEDTSRTLSSETSRLFGAEDITTILYLFHSKTGELGLSSSQRGEMPVNLKSKKGDIFDEWTAKNMQSLRVEDVRSDFRFDIDKIDLDEGRVVRSLMSVPLIVGNKTLGILRLDSPKEKSFAMEDLRFLSTIGDLGAIAIENAQLYERVEELAIKDSLTGLYLRRYLLQRLGEEISRQLRRKKQLSFLMIDLDRFKDYNDKYGHMAGDIVLKTVGMILLDTFKEPGDLVSRYGGEEFAVLLPDRSKEEAIQLAEDLRKKIKNHEIILRKQKTNIAVSIGVATFPIDAQLKDELIHVADSAMYEAKRQGRNRVCSS